MSRSLKVASQFIPKVKSTFANSSFGSQQALATETGLSRDTIRKFLSGKPIDRLNFIEISERLDLDWQEIREITTQPQIDWGGEVNDSVFYGRTQELATLTQWITQDNCRVIALLGMGGIGKTALAEKLTQAIADEFDFVIWRSLRESPPLNKILGDLVQFLSNQQETDLPDTLVEKIAQLMKYLDRSRCLLVLDNLESIFQGETYTGQYLEGYEEYGELLRRIGGSSHQSCLIVTSREKPTQIANAEGVSLPVRTLLLRGLQSEAQQIFQGKGLSGSEAEMNQLTNLYSGSPLALNIISPYIEDLFSGEISEFLEAETIFFDNNNNISSTLDQQFNRLSELEKTIMYWLVINREPVSDIELQNDIFPQSRKSSLLTALNDLKRRFLVESVTEGFTLQNVVMEYLTKQLIERIRGEIETQNFALLHSHALMKATSRDYVRESQIRLIIKPILESFANIEEKLEICLSTLRNQSQNSSYAAGNILNLLNLLCNSKRNLEKFKNYDFSNLHIWQVYLQESIVQGVNFSNSCFKYSVFTQTFGSILSISYSHSGKLLAAGDNNGKILILQIENNQPIRSFSAHPSWIESIVFSPNEEIIASGSDDRTIKIWNVDRNELLCTLRGHEDRVKAIAFSPSIPDGEIIASGSSDKTIKIWNTYENQCLHTLRGHNSWISSIAFSPDGEIIASGSSDKTIKLWKINTGKLIRTFECHDDEIRTVVFSPDGKIIASGSSDRTIKLWNISTGELIYTFHGHSDRVRSVVFSPDGKILASGSSDRTVKIWDVETGQCLRTCKGHNHWIQSVKFNPNGNTIASGSYDQTVKIWKRETGHCLHTFYACNHWIQSVKFNLNGTSIAGAIHNQIIKIWNVETSECIQTFDGHKHQIRSIDFNPNSETLASGSCDRTIKIWDIQTGQCLQTFRGHRDGIRAVAFSPSGKILASSSEDRNIKIWNVETGDCLHTLQGHHNRVRAISFSPDGIILASGSSDQTINIWNVETGQLLRTCQGHCNGIRAVAFSVDGKILASGSSDRTVKIWNVETGDCLHTLEGHLSRVRSVAFSPNQQVLVSGSGDQSIKIWDINTGQCLDTLQEHTGWVFSVVFNPDGTILASGSADGTIKLWDTTTWNCIKTLCPPRPYEGMNITGVQGLTDTQKANLKALGAVDYSDTR
jgi:WD40 repeat protein